MLSNRVKKLFTAENEAKAKFVCLADFSCSFAPFLKSSNSLFSFANALVRRTAEILLSNFAYTVLVFSLAFLKIFF